MKRTRAVPARSRVTVRRTGASLQRTDLQRTVDVDLASALRQGREALVDIEGQLDALLAVLRQPGATPDAGAPERLRGAARQVGSALARVGGR